MKKVLGAVSLLMCCFGLQAATLAPPTGLLQVGGSEPTQFTMYATGDSKVSLLNVDVRGSDWALTGNASVNPDPYIDYGFTFKNFGSTDLNFLILLTTPYIGGPYTIGKSSHSGSITDSHGVNSPANGVVTVIPQGGGIHQPSVDGNAFGAIIGGCSLSGAPEDSFPCGLQNVNAIAMVTGNSGSLSLLLGGTLSAGDVYTFNGIASISNLSGDEIPEPGTMGLGMVAIGVATLIRKRMVARRMAA